jgi:hypothetical protein
VELAVWPCWLLIRCGNILSEEMKRGIRNANVGIAAMVILLIVGLIVLPDSESAAGVYGVGAFAFAFGVYFFFEWRDEKRAHGKTARRLR